MFDSLSTTHYPLLYLMMNILVMRKPIVPQTIAIPRKTTGIDSQRLRDLLRLGLR
jgi:hypothetical protein